MRAGVADEVGLKIKGQIGVFRTLIIKGKLQNLHARKIESVAQLRHFGRHKTQIFGPNRQMAQFMFQRVEKRIAGAFGPSAVDGSFLAMGDLPIGFKSTEMVDANDINVLGEQFEPLYPPVKARSFQMFPIVNRIAPQLPRGAEVIRRHASHQLGFHRFGDQFKVRRIGPDIDAVKGDIKRNVPHDSDATLVSIITQNAPLPEKGELHEFIEIDRFAHLGAGMI